MLIKTLTAEQVGDRHIAAADRAGKRKPPRRKFGEIHDLQLQHARVVSLPEPVNVPELVNGRRLEPWEAGLYVEWAHGQRRAELALFAGLVG